MRGLANVGNTCGINTLIQCIGHVPTLREWLLDYLDCNQNTLAHELGEILHLQWNEKKSIIPKKFIHAFFQKIPLFTMGEQHDLCELWTMLVDKMGSELHQEVHRVKYTYPYPILQQDVAYHTVVMKASKDMYEHNKHHACEWTDLVQGIQISQLQCTKCKHILHNIEPWCTLHVELHGDNVAHAIEKYMEMTIIDDWKCENCGHSVAEQVVRFWNLPKVFVITLKRFEYEPSRGGLKKRNDPMHIPETMEFTTPHVLGIDARQYMNKHQQKMTYHLRSLGLHHGNAANGHYTSIGHLPELGWNHYDDTRVNALTPERTLQQNASVYMLFYERDDS
jgi:ubiquitin carboxyl-terminal hydrolase 8